MIRKLAVLLIAFILVATIFLRSQTFLVLAADAYGDQINYVEVWQWNGTAYVLRANFTSTGQSVRVEDNHVIKFVVSIKFNSTFASSQAEAISYTRVYMNITNGGTIWNNEELNNTECTGPTGNFYYLKEEGIWNSTGKPVAGVTYACSIVYQGYY